MARLLFTVLFSPQVRTKPQLWTPNLSEDTFLRDTSSKSLCTDLPDRSVIRDSDLSMTLFSAKSAKSRMSLRALPRQSSQFQCSFMRYGRHLNRVTWLVNAHPMLTFPRGLTATIYSLLKASLPRSSITGAYRVLATLC